jgi:glycerophosphoryl diester phosphodiesterase
VNRPTTRKLLFGHRGARAHAPENTILSFARALSDGANAIELDVHRTKDGVIVAIHDDDGARMANDPRVVDAVSAADLVTMDVGWGYVAQDGGRPFSGRGLSPPKLKDVLRSFPGVTINIDLKTKDKALREGTLRVVDDEDAWDRVVIASFYDDVIDAVVASGARCRVSLARNSVRLLRFLPTIVVERLLARFVRREGTRVQIPPKVGHIRLDSQGFMQRAHDLGFFVDYWVINDLHQAQVLLQLGADGIISDDPAALRGLFPGPLEG